MTDKATSNVWFMPAWALVIFALLGGIAFGYTVVWPHMGRMKNKIKTAVIK